jgi:glutamyl-tRNA reductase
VKHDLVVVGLSHRTAPLDVREKLAFPDDVLPAALEALGKLPSVGEAMLLSTCNRVEVYAASRSDAPQAIAEVRQFLGARGLPADRLAEHLYDRAGPAAVKHVFRVASSLDSLVVGEPQILGQMKSAYGVATQLGAVGPLLGRCVERAFGVAKRVRTETAIARGAANVSSVAVELAKSVFGELDGKTVLVVGAGKMSALAARHLADDGASHILVTNRSPARAEALAGEVGGQARPWEALAELLVAADVVVSSTGATEPVITRDMMKGVVKARRHRPIFLVDIAVPRDVAPDAGKLDGVYLFDIDDLERVVADNRKGRERESSSAELIVEAETRQFLDWQRAQHVVPTIKELRARVQEIAHAEAKKTLSSLGQKAAGHEEAIIHLADAIVAKLLHKPTVAIRADDTLAEAARRLFDLDGGAPGASGERK